MSFFKKLFKGVGNAAKSLVKGATKAVSKVTGFASKILPGPIGDLAKGASNITGFTSKLLSGKSGNTGISQKKASAAVLPPAPSLSSSTVDDVLGEIGLQKKTPAWVLPTVIGTGISIVLGLLFWMFSRKKK